MDLNHQKELFSIAMTTAVLATSGCDWSKGNQDFGIDLHIHGENWLGRPQIDVQLKSTASLSIKKPELGVIKYPLEAKNYNDLVSYSFTPRILILAIIPKNTSSWMNHENNQISLRHDLYWVKLKGEPTTNKRNITISIPIENRFDTKTLNNLMNEIIDTGGLS